MKNDYIPALENLTQLVNTKLGGIDQENFDKFKLGILSYRNETQSSVGYLMQWENKRSLTTILIFLFYLSVCGMSFYAFFKRKPNFLLFLAMLLLFSIPLLLVFQGLLANYYFFYSDTCQAVHDAIYENQFPVKNDGLGYYVSCFGSDTKASMYSYIYQLESVNSEINRQLAGNNTIDTITLKKLKSMIFDAMNDSLYYLSNCYHVYSSVEYFEERFCASGMKWSNYLISTYSWLILVIFLCSYGINRLKPIVEKKKSDIEVSLILN